MEYQEVDSVTFIFAKKQLDGPVHDLRLRCAFTQLLRRLLCHVAEANQQGIQRLWTPGGVAGRSSCLGFHMNGQYEER